MKNGHKHQQIQVKINAEVDEGIAELVSVLSSFEHVYTFENCQDSALGAFVCLHYGSYDCPKLIDTVQFAKFLAKLLDGNNCTVSVEWGTVPCIVLRLHPSAIHTIASILECRKNGFECGNHDTEPGNWRGLMGHTC